MLAERGQSSCDMKGLQSEPQLVGAHIGEKVVPESCQFPKSRGGNEYNDITGKEHMQACLHARKGKFRPEDGL